MNKYFEYIMSGIALNSSWGNIMTSSQTFFGKNLSGDILHCITPCIAANVLKQKHYIHLPALLPSTRNMFQDQSDFWEVV